MKQKLEKLGSTQSNADPCLFISSTVMCLIYVDDALLVYKDQTAVDSLTKRMEQEKMLFNVESDVAGYLGVLIDRDTDGMKTMRHSGLARRIIEALHLEDALVHPLKHHVQHTFLSMRKEHVLQAFTTTHQLSECCPIFKVILELISLSQCLR
jgi:hypothetical protein